MNSNTRNIVVTVKTRKQDNSTPKAVKSDVNKEEDTNGYNYSYLTSVMVNQAFQYVKGIVAQVANYEVNKYYSLRDNYEGQQDYNNAMSMIGFVVQSANTIFSTAQMGFSVGGPIGAIVGAVVATAFAGITKGIDVYQTLDAQGIQIAQAGAQQVFSVYRSGNNRALTNNSIGENL